MDVFVPRNCTVEDLEVDLTARHLEVKRGLGVFRRHWAKGRGDEASWHLVDDDGRRRFGSIVGFAGFPQWSKTKAAGAAGRGTSARSRRWRHRNVTSVAAVRVRALARRRPPPTQTGRRA